MFRYKCDNAFPSRPTEREINFIFVSQKKKTSVVAHLGVVGKWNEDNIKNLNLIFSKEDGKKIQFNFFYAAFPK